MAKKMHTAYGAINFEKAIFACVAKLPEFAIGEGQRITALREAEITDATAESLVLRAAVDKKVIPLRLIAPVLKEWRTPEHECFQARTAWSLFNGFTAALGYMKDGNAGELARRTMRLSGFMAQALGLAV
jgi:hypothetical protein